MQENQGVNRFPSLYTNLTQNGYNLNVKAQTTKLFEKTQQ